MIILLPLLRRLRSVQSSSAASGVNGIVSGSLTHRVRWADRLLRAPESGAAQSRAAVTEGCPLRATISSVMTASGEARPQARPRPAAACASSPHLATRIWILLQSSCGLEQK